MQVVAGDDISKLCKTAGDELILLHRRLYLTSTLVFARSGKKKFNSLSDTHVCKESLSCL